jgi:hypothetical protein
MADPRPPVTSDQPEFAINKASQKNRRLVSTGPNNFIPVPDNKSIVTFSAFPHSIIQRQLILDENNVYENRVDGYRIAAGRVCQ